MPNTVFAKDGEQDYQVIEQEQSPLHSEILKSHDQASKAVKPNSSSIH